MTRSTVTPTGSVASVGDAWRAVPGWPEYEVSESGAVRRVVPGRGATAGRILRPWRNKQTGYLQVSLWRGNQDWRTTVHRLVALAFLGKPPSAEHVVAHRDGSRGNNHWTNLRWATQRDNMADTVVHGTHNRGSRNGQAKIDEVCALAIRRMVAMRVPRTVAAEGFGLCRQVVDNIVNGRRWRHVR
ncbi:MAG TPA: NUMOD4 motif-containing HNH endonuclease [Falsiroseomonas sp.]|nr:NUMOD4 motif-containing HNH endonuclease [Falsiroseomonas sp.]